MQQTLPKVIYETFERLLYLYPTNIFLRSYAKMVIVTPKIAQTIYINEYEEKSAICPIMTPPSETPKSAIAINKPSNTFLFTLGNTKVKYVVNVG